MTYTVQEIGGRRCRIWACGCVTDDATGAPIKLVGEHARVVSRVQRILSSVDVPRTGPADSGRLAASKDTGSASTRPDLSPRNGDRRESPAGRANKTDAQGDLWITK